MKIFISWSGAISHKVAVAIKDWMPSVIQAVEPFVSSEDIERGARWFSDIGIELEKVNFGILCITSQNLNAPWILFEAGALSKSMGQSRVSPLLIGVKHSDLEGPLSQFNATSIDKPEFFKLMKTINKQLDKSALPDKTIERAFEKWWPELSSVLEDVVKVANKAGQEKIKPTRTQGEILEEILELTRGIARQFARAPSILLDGKEIQLSELFPLITPSDSSYNTLNDWKQLKKNFDDFWELRRNLIKEKKEDIRVKERKGKV